MITKKMNDALNEQINAELWSAYLYLSMSLDAQSKALKGVANWFYVQWLEEQDHARIFQEYICDQDGKVTLKPISGVPDGWTSPLEMFKAALEHERKVTRLIGELVQLAWGEKDLATLSRLQWFVDEQVEEEKNVREMIDAFVSAAESSFALYELDKELERREYERAAPLG